MANRLNRRYRLGFLTGETNRALPLDSYGVLLHQFDTIDADDPHHPPESPTWILSVEEPRWSDRISATLVCQRARRSHRREILPIYSDVQAGIILAPAHTRVLCSFSRDGETQGRVCAGSAEGCVPGCSSSNLAPPQWCHPGRSNTATCAWAPSALGSMLAAQIEAADVSVAHRYNEVILDAAQFAREVRDARLPCDLRRLCRVPHCCCTRRAVLL